MLNRYKFFRSFLKLGVSIKSLEEHLSEKYGKTAILLNSSRTGLYLSLASKGFRRTDEIYVPNFVSQCVLNTLNRCAFPSHSLTEKTKGILILHQWGYPQKMDEVMKLANERDYFIIEDCAHTMTSKYKGKYLGLFGDSAIFSFPKVFPTVMGGFLLTNDEEIIEYSLKFRESRKSILRSIFLNLMMFVVYENQIQGEVRRSEFLKECLEMCYSVNVDFPRVNGPLSSMINNAVSNFESLDSRVKNLEVYKSNFSRNYLETLEKDCTVVPYLVPYFDSVDKLLKINHELIKNNIESSIMHFDVNKNIFDNNYVKCLALPCHQGLSQNDVKFICNLVKALKDKE